MRAIFFYKFRAWVRCKRQAAKAGIKHGDAPSFKEFLRIIFFDHWLTAMSADDNSKAMIRSSRRDRNAKIMAEILAIIADAHPDVVAFQPIPVRGTDEWLWDSATEFCAAMEKYYAVHGYRSHKLVL